MPKVNQTEQALAFLNVVKGLDPAALRDIERIAAVTDGHGRDGIPDKQEVPTSPSKSMRGGFAAPDIASNSEFQRQDSVAWDYQLMSERMDSMQKGLAAMASSFLAMTKAAEKPSGEFMHEKDTTDKVAKALRKSRIAVRKAESAEEERDIAEATEKAEETLKACDEEIEKAEEEVETEEDEKFVEKSRTEFSALRKALRAAKAARVKKAEDEKEAAEKAAATAKAEEEAREKEAAEKVAAAKAAECDGDDMEKAAAALKAIGLGDLFATMSKAVSAQTSVASAPDFFSKSAANPVSFAQRVATAGLTAGEESVAESLNGRFELVKSGRLSREQFDAAVQAAPDSVRNLFV